MDEDEIMTDAAASSTANAFDSFNKKSKGKSTEPKDTHAVSNAASDATLPW